MFFLLRRQCPVLGKKEENGRREGETNEKIKIHWERKNNKNNNFLIYSIIKKKYIYIYALISDYGFKKRKKKKLCFNYKPQPNLYTFIDVFTL